MEDFKKRLAEEAEFKLSEETMNLFCSCMEEVHIKKYDYMIKSGDIDNNIYIVKDGIIRRTHEVGDKIMTNSFAIKGSVLMSWHCYYYNQPSYSQFQACCDSVLMKVTKAKFDELIATSHEFAQWALSLAHGTLYYQEFKSRAIKGTEKTEMSTENPRAVTQAVRVVPMLAPMITPMALPRVRRPAFTKLTTMIVVAEEDCTRAVTPRPVSTRLNLFEVICARKDLNLSPAVF